jgi:hypothetical protein
MHKDKMINLLRDCAEQLYEQDYNRWYSANTMLSFEEWRSNWSKVLIDRCNEVINELGEE